ncbi:MAG: CoA pyrophosphatase [Gammaproteobacteria bacterium]|nr:CoA pyrophosphatase [Gammaproteobacteria bacterium]
MRQRIRQRLTDTSPPDDPIVAAKSSAFAGRLGAVFEIPLTPAAVLVPVVDHVEEPSLLLTQRTAHLKDHPGQISFPGGRVESADAGPADTALRETEEEIGLGRDDVELIGYLPAQAIVTGFAVTPVVGFLAPGYPLRVDAFEVAEVFEVPISFFLDPDNLRITPRTVRGHEFMMPEYRYGARRIWGATALMISSFIEIIK